MCLFPFCSCADRLLPPEPAPHSTRAVWVSGETEICPVQEFISSATEFRTYIRGMGAPVSKSILNLLRLLKCSKSAPPYPHRCVTCTQQTQSTPFPQPCLLQITVGWNEWQTPPRISRFIIWIMVTVTSLKTHKAGLQHDSQQAATGKTRSEKKGRLFKILSFSSQIKH